MALSTLTLSLWSIPALALDKSLDLSQYAHTAWTFRSGFLNGAVYAIAQTRDGYLWLGTQSGVARFDGVRAVPLVLPRGQELPSTAVGALLAGRDGTLWIGTFDGLASWNNGRLTEYPALAHQTVLALVEGRDGTVWAGGFGSPTGKLCAIRSGNATCYGDDGSLGAAVASLYEDADGSLWVGAATGVWRWNAGSPTRYLERPVPNSQAFTQGDHGAGAMVAVDSVYQLAGGNFVNFPLQGAPSPLTARTLLRDRRGGLWIGTQAHGIAHSYEGKTFLFTQADGLTSDLVVALFEDREGTIWVATPNGLDQFRESPVGSLSVNAGLSSATTTSILAARDRSIWIGTADGLNRWQDGRMRIYRTRSDPGLPDDSIQSLFEDESGRIWVSGFRGLAVFENGRFTAVPSVPAGIVHAIASDTHGGLWLSMWLAADDYGLVHLAGGKIIEQVPWRKIGGGPGTGLAPDPDGGVWTGLLSGGIAHFRAGQIQKLPLVDEGGRSRRLLELGRDSDGSLWAAAENGLSRIKNGRVATLTTANGLPCNAVHWIIQDNQSSYWLYTRCGLLRIARAEVDAWAADPRRTVRATTFDAADGIRAVAALKGFRPAVTKSSDGKIWFLNGDTVSVIDPARIGINTLPPPVHIDQMVADDKSYDLRPGMRLPANVRNLRIEYTALSLVAPEKTHFKYKLEGQNRNWHEVINERQVMYTNLPPRNYRFRVMASNNSGVWNETGDTLEFSIAPAYYQTNWFRALLAAMFLALLWAAYQFRVRQLQRESRQLRDVIETIPAMAWTALPGGSNTFVNRRWAEYTGLSAEETAGSGWTAVVHPEDHQPYSEKWRASLDTGEPFESEARFRCSANGEYRWFLARGVPLRDDHGKISRWYGILTDIEDRKRAEETFRESEARFRTLVEHAADAIFVYDFEQGTIVDVNPRACEGLGYTREELVRMDPLAFHPDLDRVAMESVADRAAAGETVFDTHWHRRKDGTLFPVEVNTSLFRYGGRRFLLKVARDITDRLRVEEAVRRSEKQLRDVIDTIPAYVWSALPDGPLDFLNKRCVEFSGLSFEQNLGRGWETVLHPEDRDRFLEESHAAITSGEPLATEARYQRADGQYRWLLIRAIPLRDETGTIVKWYGANTDIDDRKRAEETLRETETRFRTYIDQATDAFFVLEFEGGAILDVNRRACENLGYPREELIGKTVFDLDAGLDPEWLDQNIRPRIEARESVTFETRHRRKDGSVFPVEIRARAFQIGGRIVNLSLVQDITERKRAEEERERLRQLEADLAHINRVSMMGELAASIAHEVNQPLAGIVSNGSACLRFLAGDPPNVEEVREALRDIVRDGKRAGEVIARIRALTKRTAPPSEELDLNETVQEVLAIVGDEARKNSAVIRTQFANDLSPVLGDRVQLQQVLLNLVMNAMEAMSSAGERRLVITTQNIDQERVQVTVEDSGTGLDPNMMSRIFEPFYTTKIGGMGMGLSISRSIVQSHGGRLWATANDGQGTSFQFTLPKYRGEESNAGAAAV
ncbi:MAG TPA: PAS domain S-box protein [Bryobacteraceae bacterium]|jgi:PAS domain S-box-containing protein|nr:PAS domain S-box protein [Bryobacteraceae bacterium]